MAQIPQDVMDKLNNLGPTATGKRDRESEAIANQQMQQQQLQAALDKNVVDRSNAERALVINSDLAVLRPIYEAMSDTDPRAADFLALIGRWADEATDLAQASDE